MGKTLTLPEKRNELENQLAGYRSLPEYVLDGVGALFQFVFDPRDARARKTFLPPDASAQEDDDFPSYWVNGIVIAIFTFLIGWAITAFEGRSFSPDEYKLTLWAVVTGALALIANKVNIRAFLNTFRRSCADKMLRTADIDNLENWLAENFKVWKPLLSGLLIGPFLGWFLYISWLLNHPLEVPHWGSFVILALASIQAVWVAYYLYPFYVAFPSRLNRYHFDLYTPDPSSSEVVGRLSRLLTFILYITVGFIVWLTVGLTYVDVLTAETPAPGLVFSAFIWAPTVILYAAGQFHLSDVITRAKWKMLNEVQTKVEGLYKEKKIPDRDTLDRLNKLMDYHDRIKGTPDSALNFRASLNFLNSLLLPILAFVIANLKDVLGFFK
ncbi:MAG TPA: hypothetical protein VHM28_11975 [Anaerolineales bacterium]|nr:hypothetical protein [Anaerolineales bacterium]